MRWLCLAVLALMVSGCTVEPPTVEGGPNATGLGPGGTTPPGTLPATNGTAPLPNATLIEFAPTWVVGQWWKYRTPNGDDTRVVTADGGAAYQVETSSGIVAYFDALFDVSQLGAVRKSDLAGAQRGTAVEFYRFPLQANMTWTTMWDGQQTTITVLGPQPANMGAMTHQGMALEARVRDVITARYNLVPDLGWFTYMEFPGQGPTGSYRLDLAASGLAYNGTIAKANVQDLYHDGPAPTPKPQGTFSVPSGLTFLDAEATFRGDAVQVALTFTAPDNTVIGPLPVPPSPCTANCSVRWNLTIPPKPGAWNVAVTGTVQGGQVAAVAELIVRGAEITQREFR